MQVTKHSIAGVITALALLGGKVSAAPGEISQAPLFIGNDVKSNVLFVLDDSGSMENEILITQDAQADDIYGGYPTGGNATGFNITPPYNFGYDRLRLCKAFNALAYNPEVTYVPWTGSDKDGNPYTDQLITSARYYAYGQEHRNEYDLKTNNTETANLLSNNVGYTRWDDDNGNGKFDRGECGDRFLTGFFGTYLQVEDSHFVSTMSMTAEEQTNFANWFTYYRKRRFVLNASMLDILADIDMRVGLASINRDSSVAQEVVDIAEGNNRADIIASFQSLGSVYATPLRRPLESAGRYFAGQTVDSGFVSNGNNPSSPILDHDQGGICQQNFTMLMTDGYSNERGASAYPYYGVGNADGDNSSVFDGGLFGDIYSNTMADIAMHYYENDLKPDDTLFPDKVKSNLSGDDNPAQHMVTYTVAFGVTGNLSGFPATEVEVDWPTASAESFWTGEQQESIDDLMHAAFNGRGQFLSALNPEELKQSLTEVVTSIAAASEGTAAAVGFNSTNIASGTLVYQSRFFSDHWNGTIEAFDFSTGSLQVCPVNTSLECPMITGDDTTCPVVCVPAEKKFDAGGLLDTRVATEGHADRDIITFNGQRGVPFAFPQDLNALSKNDISLAMVNDIMTGAGANASIALGQERVAFLRGDNSLADGVTYRDRGGHVLGDLAHSVPQIVGPPSNFYPNFIQGSEFPYSDFVSAQKDRQTMIYVGANDGMLHGFNADNGQEVFAYMPSLVLSQKGGNGLNRLMDINYMHRAYVDGTPTVADVFVDGKWRTYLVGVLGAGGAGVYVLDVTDPTQLTEENASQVVVREFTHRHLGYGFSRPQIAKMNNGKWAAIFGNGYGADRGDGKARLYILYLDGSGRKIISTGAGSIVNSNCLDEGSDCNGLSSPTLIDLDGNATLDRVYAGDLHGNLWAFDLTAQAPKNWGIAHEDNQDNAQPLFTACQTYPCTSENRQPITTAPAVTGHGFQNDSTTSPNTFILFGTGQYITTADIGDISEQAFYGVWDSGSEYGGLTANDLTSQRIINVNGVRTMESNQVEYKAGVDGNYGWYTPLPASGERSVINPIVAGELVLYATSIPDESPCASGGAGYLMAADLFQGSVPDFEVFDDDDIEEDFQTGIDLFNLPVGSTYIDGKTVIPDSTGNVSSIDTNVTKESKSRRVGWSIIR